MWYIHIKERSSTLNFKGFMVDMNQSDKNKCCIILLIEAPKIVQFIEINIRHRNDNHRVWSGKDVRELMLSKAVSVRQDGSSLGYLLKNTMHVVNNTVLVNCQKDEF